MNISSSYEYGNQVNSLQQWQKLLEKRKTEGSSGTQDLIMTLGSTLQTGETQKAVSPLADLVSDGTITSDQEQAIKEALDAARMAFQTKAGSESASSNSAFKDPLASLVSSGTLTEDQLSSVKSALESSKPQGMQGMKGMQGMPLPPPPSMESAQGETSDSLSSLLDEMMKSGNFTSEQQQYIQSMFQSAMSAYSTQTSNFEDQFINAYVTKA